MDFARPTAPIADTVEARMSNLLLRWPRMSLFCAVLTLPVAAQTPPDQVLLKDYKPKSSFKIPETRVEKAKYRAIDVHSHNYAPQDADVDRWVKTMDEVGIERTIILTGATGEKFVELLKKYGRHAGRFELWCSIDYTGFDQPDYATRATAELERCRKAGAMGVGELSDKGRGLGATSNALGMH